jgi:hypothetical protein
MRRGLTIREVWVETLTAEGQKGTFIYHLCNGLDPENVIETYATLEAAQAAVLVLLQTQVPESIQF